MGGYEKLICFVNGGRDGLVVREKLCRLGEEGGLGMCYVGSRIYNGEEMIDLVEVGKVVVGVGRIRVGYGDEWGEEGDGLGVEGIMDEEK